MPALRVLVVDDSLVVRSAVEKIFANRSDVVIAAKASNIRVALAYLEDNMVDVILLDHEMPGRNGLDALPDVLKACHGARVIMLSGYCAEGSQNAVQALANGASDVILKPGIGDYRTAFSENLVDRVLRLGARPGKRAQSAVPLHSISPEFQLRCIGIGASTGGIPALSTLLKGAQLKFNVPILLTQHLPTDFMHHFATQLARATDLPVDIARHGERLRNNHVYIAPGGHNLLCVPRGRGGVEAVISDDRDGDMQSLPAVNPMFRSMAESYGSGALGIVLTGMGRDGTDGARAIVNAGGTVIVQDQDSAVIWGMPGSVSKAGLAAAVLPPEQMPAFISQYSRIAA
ncbi:chemotaxis protein CheB [Sphingobium subterraneum]|uniref:protein-glutamate methylesterase n=1 Tax=Sphingobium subterraneum TaxID=627688 RepID=A0A841IUF4_9SPHN|nr:chemotaxis protein CheB [Sphingobium subterraneum]MBB6122317.1 two-component system chemotaxis response regulator CheB [Sphingobium subterraneum]